MTQTEFACGMLRLSKKIIKEFDKDKAVQVLEDLDQWARAGTVTPYQLEQIVFKIGASRLPVDGTYDETVQRNLVQLYSDAADTGEYNIELIEAGINAHRSYQFLHKFACKTHKNKEEFDLLSYVSDSRWSDNWVEQIGYCADYIIGANKSGFDIMSVFTPKHRIESFYEVCYTIYNNGGKVEFPTEWLKDANWTTDVIRVIINLYKCRPEFDWVKVITPDVCIYAVQEIYTVSRTVDTKDCERIIAFWSNVSPKLEHALKCCSPSKLDGEEARFMYKSYKKQFSVDGNILADKLFSDKYPNKVLEHQEYWNKIHGNVNYSKSESLTGAIKQMLGN